MNREFGGQLARMSERKRPALLARRVRSAAVTDLDEYSLHRTHRALWECTIADLLNPDSPLRFLVSNDASPVDGLANNAAMTKWHGDFRAQCTAPQQPS